VNTGLILAADDEAELAGVLAHEIAHVAARNATENASKEQVLDIATIPLIFLGGPAGIALRQAAGMPVPMQFLQFSRKAEAEADFLGVQYLYQTGYDPSAFLTFFEKLQAKEKMKPGTHVEVIQHTSAHRGSCGHDKKEYRTGIAQPRAIRRHDVRVRADQNPDRAQRKPIARKGRKQAHAEDENSAARRRRRPSAG
jgi:predicted Zn-dependent protease